MTLKNIFLFAFPVLLGTSCNKFLDVKPKTQIDADVAFSDEQGYIDALTGVYIKMSENDLYGKELSFGLTDVLSKQYTRFNSTFHEYYDASQYNYINAAVRAKIDAIWLKQYGAIANVNNLLGYLKNADQKMFRDVNYSIINGEAHGLRAFLHFDLLRLFAPAPASSGGMSAVAIPYMDRLTSDVLPGLKVEDVIKKILADCEVAEQALKTIDPIVPGSTTPVTTTGYLRGRPFKFNYYAVKALEARVHLYAGDKVKALACAEEVIAANTFTWTPTHEISAGNHVLTSELIFTLYKSDMIAFTDNYFSPAATSLLTKSNDSEFLTVYESTEDIRYTLLTLLDNTSSMIRYSTKLSQPATAPAYTNRVPVIRISEMYYIAAECLAATDMTKAVTYLNAVRRARNIQTDLEPVITPAQLQDEIFKEYRKEFFCEGQLFYYYKRLNKSTIEYSDVNADNTIYVLPLPDDEVQYGNR